MADLSSILGGMIQGFKDFGTGLVDMFGTAGAAIGDSIASIQSGKATSKNQDDFRKWLYNTDSVQDAAAKGLGTALNGVSAVADVIPGAQAVTANPLFNGLQGAIGGLSDELKMNGENADWGKAAQRAGVGAASGLASGYAGNALGKSSNKLLSNGLTRGAVSGALNGSIANAGYTGIEGGSAQDMINSALYGASTGALVGGSTGLARELIKPTHKMDARLTDAERQARIENAQAQIDELGPVPIFSNDPEYVAKRARKLELNDAIKAYRSGYDTVDEYNAAMAAKRANKREYKAPEAQYAPIIGEEVILDATQVPEGYTRLYRGLENEFDPKYVPQVSDNGYGYESWSDTYDLAREYAGPNGERMPVVKTDKKAGMKSFDGKRFIDGKEYLLNVNDPLRQELTYSKVKPKTVADLMTEPKQKTVADLMLSDDEVMAAKVAPGQLGLFDQPMPTKKPVETTGQQVSLFDQPKQPTTKTAVDTEPVNPYAPVDGQVTQTMRDRAEEVLKNWKKNGVPENELYNRIDESTLPEKIKNLRELTDKGEYEKITESKLGAKNIEDVPMDVLLDYLYDGDQGRIDRTKLLLESRPGDGPRVNRSKKQLKNRIVEETQRKIDEENELYAKTHDNPINATIRKGYTAAADELLSERLGIAPGNTPKYNGAMDIRRAYGRYRHPNYGEGGNISVFEKKMNGPEDAISTVAHERLHSFQGETASRSNGRYNKEVIDAYNELRKDLGHHYKTYNEIKDRYKTDTSYWLNSGEQESRMFQQYLENKGYADSSHMKEKSRSNEWGDEINPAFDKFIDKLRDLSKRGIALPALATLFGGGALLANANKKEEEDIK